MLRKGTKPAKSWKGRVKLKRSPMGQQQQWRPSNVLARRWRHQTAWWVKKRSNWGWQSSMSRLCIKFSRRPKFWCFHLPFRASLTLETHSVSILLQQLWRCTNLWCQRKFLCLSRAWMGKVIGDQMMRKWVSYKLNCSKWSRGASGQRK